jgi:hypothetical protein
VALLLAAAAGCASASYEKRAIAVRSAPEPANVQLDGRPAGGAAAAGGGEQTAVVGSATEPATAAAERQVIYNGRFAVQVYDVRRARRDLIAWAKGQGGHMQATRGNQVVLRLPAERFDAVEPALRELGRVLDDRTVIEARDVTAEVMDVELRLETKRDYLDTLRGMLAADGSLEDKLAVQREIARVVEEIERIEGRLRLLRNQIAMATVTVDFELATAGSQRTFKLPWGWLDWLGLEQLLP